MNKVYCWNYVIVLSLELIKSFYFVLFCTILFCYYFFFWEAHLSIVLLFSHDAYFL